jgi:hypothetical protein
VPGFFIVFAGLMGYFNLENFKRRPHGTLPAAAVRPGKRVTVAPVFISFHRLPLGAGDIQYFVFSQAGSLGRFEQFKTDKAGVFFKVAMLTEAVFDALGHRCRGRYPVLDHYHSVNLPFA